MNQEKERDEEISDNDDDNFVSEVYKDIYLYLNRGTKQMESDSEDMNENNKSDIKSKYNKNFESISECDLSPITNSDTKAERRSDVFLSNPKLFVLFPSSISSISKNKFTISLRNYLYDILIELHKDNNNNDDDSFDAVLNLVLKTKNKKRKTSLSSTSSSTTTTSSKCDDELQQIVGNDAQFLLDNVYILLPSSMQTTSRCIGFASKPNVGEQRSSQSDVVNQSISILFTRAEQLNPMTSMKRRISSILLLGYQHLARFHPMDEDPFETIYELKSIPGIECRYPNSIVSFLKRSGWETILQLIGDDLMLHLLIDVTMLLQIPNRCFIQLTGSPITKETFTNMTSDINNAENKKYEIQRKNMLYGSLYCSKRSYPYLSKKNILIRYLPSSSTDISNNKVRTFVLEIFEDNINQSKSKIKRLHPLLMNTVPYFKKLLQNVKKKYYIKAILNRVCPLPGQETIEKFNKENKSLLFEISCNKVSTFVKDVCLRIIPKKLWGNRVSRRFLLYRISQFISRGMKEIISIDQIMHGLSLKCFSWLRNLPKLKNKVVSNGLRRKQREFLCKFLCFLFNNFVIDLIQSNFYATEIEKCGYKIYYFRKEMWKKILKRSFDLQMSNRYEPADPNIIKKISFKRSYGWASIRCIPKVEEGLRYIVNHGNKTKGFKISANTALNSTFQILKYEVEQNPSIIGSSVSGFDDIFIKLSSYITNTKQNHETISNSNYYIVTLDISKCFDNIIQDKILSIISDILRYEEYEISSHSNIYADRGMECIRTRYIYKVIPSSLWTISHQSLHFIDKMNELAKISKSYKMKSKESLSFSSSLLSSSLPTIEKISNMKIRNSVFTDGVIKKYVQRSYVLIILQDLIKNNIVKFDQKLLLQTQGIPQGSIISTILCNIYFGRFEQEHLHFLQSEHLLMRLVDDFLLITKSKTETTMFVNFMHQSESSYGMTVNPLKTRSSYPLNGSSIHEWISWCGLLINSKTLNVRIDYSRILNIKLMYSFTPDLEIGKIRKSLKKILHITIGYKFHAIILDTKLNSKTNVIYNLTQVFTLCALRYHQFLNSAYKYLNGYRIKSSPKIFLEFFDFSFSLIHSRTNGKFKNCYFEIPFYLVKLIGIITFRKTLSKMKKSRILHLKALKILKSLNKSMVNLKKEGDDDDDWAAYTQKILQLPSKSILSIIKRANYHMMIHVKAL